MTIRSEQLRCEEWPTGHKEKLLAEENGGKSCGTTAQSIMNITFTFMIQYTGSKLVVGRVERSIMVTCLYLTSVTTALSTSTPLVCGALINEQRGSTAKAE